MKHDSKLEVEFRDVAAGLWVWRVEHPRWRKNQGWEPVVASTCVESRGEILVLDRLAPSTGGAELWQRLDARPPTAVVVLKPDHVRDAKGWCGGSTGTLARCATGPRRWSTVSSNTPLS